MSEYDHRAVEKKWQQFWEEQKTFQAHNNSDKPKCYVLDMFPYPSGAGLHVGHPLGYIASDIYARYKRLKGFNVLHPMGFDSFGLPAEQHAIQTCQHPAATTEKNIKSYISQLKNLGFSFDWAREVRTSDPKFYHWTQWIFLRLFDSWYNNETEKAEPVNTLVTKFEKHGNINVDAPSDDDTPHFTAADWHSWSEEEQYAVTLKYRLAYVAETTVNWAPALGSVLSNDEVKDGVSERGGFPVEQKLMRQWMLRITAYAQRLLNGLDTIDWPESLKDQQRNWIGRSVGALVDFDVANCAETIKVFTTRVDTIYGVSFMVLAPEHELVRKLVSDEQRAEIENYIEESKKRSERDRISDVKSVHGVFLGTFAVNPLNHEKVPIYIADYVLAGYGTGAVMAVPSGDQRDWDFATHFGLPIVPILDTQLDIKTQADATKEGHYINSGIINGLDYAQATAKLVDWLERHGKGKGKVNFRLRDAIFGRQRYWGEPVPIYYRKTTKGELLPYGLKDSDLPLELPSVDKYLPTGTGEPPLGRAMHWKYQDGFEYELSTMPGWAGSSWYWYRYMDPHNSKEFASKEAIDYWQNVDLYIGGPEHATGHLMYSRFWNKFLKDRGYVPEDEPFKKLINQGMIQGRSSLVYRLKNSPADAPVFVSKGLSGSHDVAKLHVDVNLVDNDVLDTQGFKKWRPDLSNADFILEDGKYICGWEIDKMSKSKFNVVNPDSVVEKYGADTLRLYEMFLGPLEQAKPWSIQGIDGTYRFIRKLWRLFYTETGEWIVDDQLPGNEALRVLHKTIKKVEEDIVNFSFNTSVSAFMVCVNELSNLKCHSRAILRDLTIILSPYAPHISEELWEALGNQPGTVSRQDFPKWEESFLEDDSFEYPVQINGKVRVSIRIGNNLTNPEIEKQVLENENVQKWMDGRSPKKVIVVSRRIVNVVI